MLPVWLVMLSEQLGLSIHWPEIFSTLIGGMCVSLLAFLHL